MVASGVIPRRWFPEVLGPGHTTSKGPVQAPGNRSSLGEALEEDPHRARLGPLGLAPGLLAPHRNRRASRDVRRRLAARRAR